MNQCVVARLATSAVLLAAMSCAVPDQMCYGNPPTLTPEQRAEFTRIFEKYQAASNASMSGNYREAIELFTQLIKGSKKDAKKEGLGHCYAQRSFCYLMLGELEKGVDDLTKAVQLNPKDATSFKNRAAAYERLGMHDLALRDRKKFELLSLQRTHEKHVPRENKYEKVLSARKTGTTADVVKEAQALVKKAPNDPIALFMLGDALFDDGKLQESLVPFNKLVSINPRDRYALNYRAIVYAALGQNRKAIADYSTVIDLKKQLSMDKMDQMVQQYSGSFIAPSLSVLYCTRAKLNELVGEHARAIADCTDAITLNQKDDDARMLRAQIYLATNKLPEAKSDFEQILRLNPNDELAAKQLATAHLQSKDYESACRLASQALSLDSHDWRTYLIRASAYDRMNKKELAGEDRKKSAQIKSEQ